MANTNAQAVAAANEKIRPLADRFGQLYNLCRAVQAEAVAEGWATLFTPSTAGEIVVDGSAQDGRAPISNLDVNNFSTMISDLVTWMEATANTRRNLCLKIAVHPEQF